MSTGSTPPRPRGQARSPRRARLAALAGLGLVLAACEPHPLYSSRRPHQVVPGADASAAPAALRDYGCNECHMIPGIRGANGLVGPPLTAFSRRNFIAGRVPNTPEALIAFLLNPQAIKPGSAMPMTGIGDQAARDVAAYLMTLR
jgi:cytochrome c